MNILAASFLFPDCLSLDILTDEPLGAGRALCEPEGSLIPDTAPAGTCAAESTCFDACPVTGLLCRHMDSTKSTSGAGPDVGKATVE